MEKKRIFVALEIPDKLKELLAQKLEGLKKNHLARIVPLSDIHITLAFCGYLNEDEIDALKRRAEETARSFRPFRLEPERMVFAPPGKRPRMIWLAFKRSSDFEDLAERFAGFAAGKARGKLLPHATLVRFKEIHFPNLKKFLPEGGIDLKGDATPFFVKRINIMESILSSAGAKYKLAATYDMI